jgi:hypothetical protein
VGRVDRRCKKTSRKTQQYKVPQNSHHIKPKNGNPNVGLVGCMHAALYAYLVACLSLTETITRYCLLAILYKAVHSQSRGGRAGTVIVITVVISSFLVAAAGACSSGRCCHVGFDFYIVRPRTSRLFFVTTSQQTASQVGINGGNKLSRRQRQ